jgi:leader peptidase (prepilin peptidase)/N-methyltransferase
MLVAIAAVPALVAVVLFDDRIRLLASIASGVAMMAVPMLVLHLVAPATMGFGDVRLAVALGSGLGVLAPRLAVLALAVASGLTLLVAVCSRRWAMPFAPGLVIGAAAALTLGALTGWSVPA